MSRFLGIFFQHAQKMESVTRKFIARDMPGYSVWLLLCECAKRIITSVNFWFDNVNF